MNKIVLISLTAPLAVCALLSASANTNRNASTAKKTNVSVSNHPSVDLGLPSGKLWATYNVGASKPEECGFYFSWGEIKPKGEFTWATYKLGVADKYDNLKQLTKYSIGTLYDGSKDKRNTLLLADDAAATNFGKGWRIPTEAECRELVENCTWTWEKVNGVEGSKVTGKNGKSIFLPATGLYTDNTLRSEGKHGIYWSSTLDVNYEVNAVVINVSQDNYAVKTCFRYGGLPIRAVREK